MNFFFKFSVCINLAILVTTFSTKAQNIDSLWRVYKTPIDSIKLNALYIISNTYISKKSADSANMFSNRLLNEARKSAHIPSMALSYISRGSYCLHISKNKKEAENWFLKALILSNKYGFNKGQVASLYNLGNIYARADYTKALNYFLQAEQCIDTTVDIYGQLKIYNNLCVMYIYVKDYDKIIDYSTKLLQITEKHKDDPKIAPHRVSSLQDIGTCYREKDNYTKSLEYTYKSVYAALKINYIQLLPDNYYNIAAVYYKLKDTQKVLNSCFIGYSYAKKTNDIRKQAHGAYLLGSYYHELLNNTTQSQHYLKEALSYYETQNDIEKTIYAQRMLGRIALSKKDLKTSLNYFTSYFLLAKKVKNTTATVFALDDLGRYYTTTNNFSKALQYYKEALTNAEQQQDRSTLSDLYLAISNCYEKTKKEKEALHYYKKHVVYQDSILNEDTKSNIRLLSLKSSFTLKSTKDSVLYINKQRISNLQMKQAALQKKYLMLIIALVLIAITLIYNRYKKTRKQKLIIENALKENRMLIAEIHHRVKNNLQLINSLLELQVFSTNDISVQNALQESQQRIMSMASIHQKLYTQNNQLAIPIDEYIKELVTSIVSSFSNKNIQLQFDVEPTLLAIDLAIPLGLIINELTTNSIKHAFNSIKNPIITIRLQNDSANNQYTFSYIDNGEGSKMNKEELVEKSFGFKIIKSLVSQLNGTWQLSTANKFECAIQFKNA